MGFVKSLFGSEESSEGGDVNPGGTTRAFNELKESIAGIGNAEYPFNSNEYKYGPESRIPCTDFTGFIVERLQANDSESICLLMKEIIRANPGVGIGPEWICREVERVLEIPFEEYVSFDDDRAYYELQALWIMASKDGGDPGSWIAPAQGFPALFARALSCFAISWGYQMERLVSRANTFVTEASDPEKWGPTVWDDYPLFSPEDLRVNSPGMNTTNQILRNLSIGARLHLLDTVERGGGVITKCAKYQTKEFGLYAAQSSEEILDSGLLTLSFTEQALQQSLTKKELIDECERTGVDFRRSWNKALLAKALWVGAQGRAEELIGQMQIVSASQQHADDLLTILAYSTELVVPLRILSFAT